MTMSLYACIGRWVIVPLSEYLPIGSDLNRNRIPGPDPDGEHLFERGGGCYPSDQLFHKKTFTISDTPAERSDGVRVRIKVWAMADFSQKAPFSQ